MPRPRTPLSSVFSSRSPAVGRDFLFWALGCAMLPLTGCGQSPQYVPVEGVLRRQGEPVANVLVIFVPAERGVGAEVRSMGQTDDQGRFTLQAETQRPGAVVGEHAVILEDMALYSAPRSEDGTVLERPPQRFLPEYGELLRTPWHVRVAPNMPPVELELP